MPTVQKGLPLLWPIMAGASCCGSMRPPLGSYNASSNRSESHGQRSFASSSPRRPRRMFPSAGAPPWMSDRDNQGG
jgi:hypothetical protein